MSTPPPRANDELSVGTWVTAGTGFSTRRAIITSPAFGWTEGEYPIHYIDGPQHEEQHATATADELTPLPLPQTDTLDLALLPERLIRKYEVRWRRNLYTPAHGLHATTIAFEYAARDGLGSAVGGPDTILSTRYTDWLDETMEHGLQHEIPEAIVPDDEYRSPALGRRAWDKLTYIGFGYRSIYRNLHFTGADWWLIEKATWGINSHH